MKVVTGYPPNIDAIDAVFHVRSQKARVVFAYGDRVYAPFASSLSPAIAVHEQVHLDRQAVFAGGVEAWWARYIEDPAFRMAEEVPAHRAEYRWHAARSDADRPVPGFRSVRLFHLQQIAKRLSSPLYSLAIDIRSAKKLLEA